ncbi:MAG: hypothetical protein KC503_09665, partial [Myxococcales bacterium]|nr:hypothetical protein [Myxococcales bacterium]
MRKAPGLFPKLGTSEKLPGLAGAASVAGGAPSADVLSEARTSCCGAASLVSRCETTPVSALTSEKSPSEQPQTITAAIATFSRRIEGLHVRGVAMPIMMQRNIAAPARHVKRKRSLGTTRRRRP